jgi:radial spoke head protein 1
VEGKGKEKKIEFEDGIHEGDVSSNGKREGKRKTKYKNGDIYEGDYKNGEREGHGRYVFLLMGILMI